MIKAVPFEINIIGISNYCPLYGGIHPLAMTTNMLHPEGMQRSVAKQYHPQFSFASRRDATKHIQLQIELLEL